MILFVQCYLFIILGYYVYYYCNYKFNSFKFEQVLIISILIVTGKKTQSVANVPKRVNRKSSGIFPIAYHRF